MKNFDEMFICWMDRIVWFILMMVFSNLLVEITGVPPKRIINVTAEQNDISHLNEINMPKDVEIINNKKLNNEPISVTLPKELTTRIDSKIEVDNKGKIISREQQQTILDSIFNIPISTLKAVNNLVQVIVGSIHIPGTTSTSGQQTTIQRRQQKIKDKHKHTKDFNFTRLSI